MTQPEFGLETSVDDNGRIVAAYMRVRGGEVAETRELQEGVAYADYDSQGELLGIELLGPCEVALLDRIAGDEPDAVKRFLTGGAPRSLVPA